MLVCTMERALEGNEEKANTEPQSTECLGDEKCSTRLKEVMEKMFSQQNVLQGKFPNSSIHEMFFSFRQ